MFIFLISSRHLLSFFGGFDQRAVHLKQSHPRACPHVGGWGLVQCSVHPSWLITLMRPWPKWGTLRNIRHWYSPTFVNHHLWASELSHSAQGLFDSLNIWRVTVLPMSTLFWQTLACRLQNVQTGHNQVWTNDARPRNVKSFFDGGNNFVFYWGSVTMRNFSQLLMAHV